MGGKAVRIVLMVAGGIALGVALAFLLGFAVQALWNWLMPPIFGLPELTYWQAWGLLILSHILLGGGPRFHHSEKHRKRDKDMSIKDELKARFSGEIGPGPC